MLAAISAPIPHWGHPSSTLTMRCVFLTDFKIAGLSKGLKERRFMTSMLMSWSRFKISAAYKECPTIFAWAVTVQSVPALSILAFPIGMRYSGSIISGVVSNSTPYIISFSRITTGSLSLIADFIKPLQSSTFHGLITFRPGTCEYQDPKHYVCWAPTDAQTPLIPLNTIGHVMSPPDM